MVEMEKISDWLVSAINHLDMAKCDINNCFDKSCKMKYNSEFEHKEYHIDEALDFLYKIVRYYKIIK